MPLPRDTVLELARAEGFSAGMLRAHEIALEFAVEAEREHQSLRRGLFGATSAHHALVGKSRAAKDIGTRIFIAAKK